MEDNSAMGGGADSAPYLSDGRAETLFGTLQEIYGTAAILLCCEDEFQAKLSTTQLGGYFDEEETCHNFGCRCDWMHRAIHTCAGTASAQVA